MKIVACDLDGTLLRDDKTISKHTKEVIKNIVKKGNIFTIVTGRRYKATKDIYDSLDLKELIIVNDGAVIRNKNKIVQSFYLDLNIVDKIVIYLKKMKKKFYVVDENENLDYQNGKVLKIIVVGEKKEMENVYSRLKKFPCSFFIQPSFFKQANYSLVIYNKNVNKGYSLQLLAEHYNVKNDDVIVFGNWTNDISLFNCFKNSIAPKNAHKSLKKIAFYVSNRTNNDDFVAHYLLNNF